ncbi:MAG: hypothetical protein ACRBFS_21740 [Aureispira sp.]
MNSVKFQEAQEPGRKIFWFGEEDKKKVGKTYSEYVKISIEKEDQEYVKLYISVKNRNAHPVGSIQLLPRDVIEKKERLKAAVELLLHYAVKAVRREVDVWLLGSYRAEIAADLVQYLIQE